MPAKGRDLAEKFIVLYWPQAAPYVAVGRTGASRQPSLNSGVQAAVIEAAARLAVTIGPPTPEHAAALALELLQRLTKDTTEAPYAPMR